MTTKRIRILLVGLLTTWVLGALWFVPALITWIHGGHGPDVLSGLMGGRGSIPLDRYLMNWDRLALQASFFLGTAAILLWFLAPTRLRRIPGGMEPSPAAPSGEGSGLGGWDWLVVSLWGGLAFGLAESYYLAWKGILREVVPQFRYVSLESLWLAPLFDVLVFLVLGGLCVGLLRALNRKPTLRWLAFLLTSVGLTALILLTDRLAVVAAVALSLGTGWQVGRVAGRRAPRLLEAARSALPWMAAAVLVTFVAARTVPAFLEAREAKRIGSAPPGAPNVLVIVMDTERAADLSLHGYARPTTPNLERLARRGVVFDRAISTAPWTLPSHGSMFTSRFPGELGLAYSVPLSSRFPTLAESLRDRGYMTAGFVGNFFFCNRLFGLNRGFVHYEAQPASMQMALESAWIIRVGRRMFRNDESRTSVRKDAAQVTADFLAWRAGRSDNRPYFVFLNFFDAHGPYSAPPAFRGRFGLSPAMPAKLRGERASAYLPGELDALTDAYNGSIAYIDEQLGVLFAEMERVGELDRTLVIVTSDHGEEFGEHGFVGHGRTVNVQALHVPLLVLDPAWPAGTRVQASVSMADLPATVMKFLGIEQHPFLGQPWSHLWEGSPAGTEEFVFSEYGGKSSLVLGQWHYIVDGQESLYDLTADPSERNDLIASADTVLLHRFRAELRLRRAHAPTR